MNTEYQIGHKDQQIGYLVQRIDETGQIAQFSSERQASTMILSRQVFEYDHRPIIEKVRIQLPFRYEGIFPDQGCFLYITGAGSRIHSATGTTQMPAKEAVLLKCGTFFVDWIQKMESQTVEVIAFHLYPETLKKLYFKGLPEIVKEHLSGGNVHRVVNDEVLGKFVENLHFYFDNPALINDDVLELKVKELVLLLIQSSSAGSVTELFQNLFTPSRTSIKEVVRQHITSDLSTTELARLCGLSLSSFKREFEKSFDDTPNNYILTQRMKMAVELLQTTQMTVSEIAFQVGFGDPSYFSRVFRKRKGISPTDFRTN
ncbi:MAG: helix-turn-helix transcriptional regulator [Cyclobacteriaceae bacterium]